MEEKNLFPKKGKLKNDLLLALIFLLSALIIFAVFTLTGKKGAFVEVTVDGKVVGRYSLYENISVDISEKNGQLNRLEIKDGSAKIVSANCPDGICKNHRAVNKTNETIVCLPHKLVVKIVSQKDEKSDITTLKG